MNDLGLTIFKKGVDGVYVLPTARAKTHVVQADAVLNKSVLSVLLVTPTYPDCRTRADVIDHILSTKRAFEAQERQ
jgi:hypothetical protein